MAQQQTGVNWETLLRSLMGDAEAYAVARAMIQLESGGNPNATNQNAPGLGIDWGLWQLNDKVGQGRGMTRAQLLDPIANIARGAGPVAGAIARGRAKGLKGWDLFQYAIRDTGAGHTALASQSLERQRAAWGTAVQLANGLAPGVEGPVMPPSAGAPAAPDPIRDSLAVPGVTDGAGAVAAGAGNVQAQAGTSLWDWIRTGDISAIQTQGRAWGFTALAFVLGVLAIGAGVFLTGAAFISERGGDDD